MKSNAEGRVRVALASCTPPAAAAADGDGTIGFSKQPMGPRFPEHCVRGCDINNMRCFDDEPPREEGGRVPLCYRNSRGLLTDQGTTTVWREFGRKRRALALVPPEACAFE